MYLLPPSLKPDDQSQKVLLIQPLLNSVFPANGHFLVKICAMKQLPVICGPIIPLFLLWFLLPLQLISDLHSLSNCIILSTHNLSNSLKQMCHKCLPLQTSFFFSFAPISSWCKGKKSRNFIQANFSWRIPFSRLKATQKDLPLCP